MSNSDVYVQYVHVFYLKGNYTQYDIYLFISGLFQRDNVHNERFFHFELDVYVKYVPCM